MLPYTQNMQTGSLNRRSTKMECSRLDKTRKTRRMGGAPARRYSCATSANVARYSAAKKSCAGTKSDAP